MTALFDYPKAAAFGRVVPKNKIYEHAGAGSKVKDLFINQVDQIVWKYKLAPETINLATSPSVAEIQVFAISLRQAALDFDVLRAIDKAVAFPLIFELSWSGRVKIVAAYKRPSEGDAAKWVVSGYFETPWVPETSPRIKLPMALDMKGLYENLLDAVLVAMPSTTLEHGQGRGLAEAGQAAFIYDSPPEPIEQRIARVEAIRLKLREVERIKARLSREKQFNRRVEIHAELRAATKNLAELQYKRAADIDDRQFTTGV